MSYSIKDILRLEVAPALGCTEPAAVALASSAAASLLPCKDVDSIKIWLSPNIFKNSMSVTIPGTEDSRGIDMAASLGVICGDPKLKLQVLEPVTKKVLKEAKKFIADKGVEINLLEKKDGIYVRANVKCDGEYAEAEIVETHDNIVRLIRNGEELANHPLLSKSVKSHNDLHELEEWLITLKLKDLIGLLDELDAEDFDFINQGIEYNLRLANYGLTYGSGLGVGLTLERLCREGLLKKDMVLAAKILTSAASDARMAGVKMAAMSSAGSGNHGLTAILPIWAVKEFLSSTEEKDILKAVALSHVITAYIKAHTGRLSAICGCSIAAGAGATGGITYLMGGTLHHIAGAIKNVIADLAGVICDGAKAGCALKLATAAGTAVRSSLFSLHGLNVKETDGIIASTPEQTMKNVGQLSTKGMIETDRTILQIMIQKKFEEV